MTAERLKQLLAKAGSRRVFEWAEIDELLDTVKECHDKCILCGPLGLDTPLDVKVIP